MGAALPAPLDTDADVSQGSGGGGLPPSALLISALSLDRLWLAIEQDA